MSTSHFPRGFAYRLVNTGSKKSLHGANPTTSPGNVVHRTSSDWDCQRWVFSRVSADDDVYVISNLDSGQVLQATTCGPAATLASTRCGRPGPARSPLR